MHFDRCRCERFHVVTTQRIDPHSHRHQPYGFAPGLECGLALGVCFWRAHVVSLTHAAQALRTSEPQVVHHPRVTDQPHSDAAPLNRRHRLIVGFMLGICEPRPLPEQWSWPRSGQYARYMCGHWQTRTQGKMRRCWSSSSARNRRCSGRTVGLLRYWWRRLLA